MDRSYCKDGDLIEFSSKTQIEYGKNITLFAEPKEKKGRLTSKVLISSSKNAEIYFKHFDSGNRYFGVINRKKEGEEYKYLAASISCIEKSSNSIEEKIYQSLKEL